MHWDTQFQIFFFLIKLHELFIMWMMQQSKRDLGLCFWRCITLFNLGKRSNYYVEGESFIRMKRKAEKHKLFSENWKLLGRLGTLSLCCMEYYWSNCKRFICFSFSSHYVNIRVINALGSMFWKIIRFVVIFLILLANKNTIIYANVI